MKSKNQLLIRPLFISSFLISSLFTIANDIKVRSITELTSDLLARTSARKDKNGKDCAIVRVNIPTIKTMSFQNVEDDNVSYQAGEYLLYVSEGTEEIPYSVDGYKPGLIKFSDYDIRVTSKKVYRVTLYIETNQSWLSTDGATLSITTEPESAVVLIDGIPVGTSPIIIPGLSKGKHIISFPKVRNGSEGEVYGLSDQVIQIQNNESIEKHIKLTKYENYKAPEVDEGTEDDKMNMYWIYDNGSWRIPFDGNDNDGLGYWPVKYIKFQSNGKIGLKDYWGKIVVPCEYDYIGTSSGDIITVSKDGSDDVGLYHARHGLITSISYRNIFYYVDSGDELFEVIKETPDGKHYYGFINRVGKEIIPCTTSNKECFKLGERHYALLKDFDLTSQTSIVIYNSKGDEILRKECKKVRREDEGSLVVQDYIDNYWLVTDSYGELKVKNLGKFTYSEMSEGLLLSEKYVEVDETLSSGRKKRFPVYQICDVEGNILVSSKPHDYGDYKRFDKGWFRLRKHSPKEEMGVVHDEVEREALNQKEREWRERVKETILIVDKNGHTYRCKEDDFHEPIDEYLPFVKDGKLGLYDQDGNLRIPFECDDIYKKGDYLVAKNGMYLSIYDHSLNKLFEFENSGSVEIKAINDGIVLLYDEASDKYGYMNLKGELLAGCFYDMEEMEYLYLNRLERENYLCIKNGMAIINIGDRYGIIDKDGNFVIPMIYRMIIPFYDGTMYARTTDGTWIVLDVEKNKNKE